MCYHKYISYSLYSRKQRTSLSFNSTARQHSVRAQPSSSFCRETPNFIIAPNLWLLNISDCSPVDYTILAMLQSGAVNILCKILISWGNVWLTDRDGHWSPLMGGDLGWGHELWPEVDIVNIWHSPVFYYCYYYCLSIRFHTLYDVSFKCWSR